MYVRPPSRTNDTENIRIPENYGGSAFRGGTFSEPRYDASQAEHPRVSRADYPPNTDRPNERHDTMRPEPYSNRYFERSSDRHFERNSDRYSDSHAEYSSEQNSERITEAYDEPHEPEREPQENIIDSPEADGETEDIADRQKSALPMLIEAQSEHKERKNSIFSSLFPPAMLQSHFPFGHGLGSEELLILGMMLMVYTSGNETGDTDNELILLLALLLFAG